MALHGLGKVTTTIGVPVVVTNNETIPGARYPVHSFMVEVLPSNSNKIYIGSSTMVRSTLAGVYAILPPPTTNVLSNFSVTVTYAPAAINLNEIFLDVDANGEGALVSAVKA